MQAELQILSLSFEEALGLVPDLAELLIDAVHFGASVTFLRPLAREKAEQFWLSAAQSLQEGERKLLVAFKGDKVVGTVQLIHCTQENQPHRAEIAKMLVHSSERRRGIGSALLRAAEDAALAEGRTVLVLDTELGGPGEKLYASLGWIRVGEIPDFAIGPDGKLLSTVFFYKLIGERPPSP
jgi:GNAT superfamily N-acetyltransferase